MKHKVKPLKISALRDMNVDTLPVGQRLPIRSGSKSSPSKSESIVQSIFDGINIGMITIMSLNRKTKRALLSNKNKFDFESIDGGHRKRAVKEYLDGEFIINGKFFRELEEKEKKDFLNKELMFCIYDNLPNEEKGRIFRTMNETTDVNFIEMVNSYGDIPIANLIREITRLVPQIENSFHELFAFMLDKNGEAKFKYLNFNNERLRIDHMVARICYRYFTSGGITLGSSSDKDIEKMYLDDSITQDVADNLKIKLEEHFDFLRIMSDYRKTAFGAPLGIHDFKVLSYLYFYILDTYGNVGIKDHQKFFDNFAEANSKLKNKDGIYEKTLHEESGYVVPVMYAKYIGAPHDSHKVKMAMSYLINELGDIEQFLDIRDTKRNFTILEKEAKLAGQKFLCAVDGKRLLLKDAHACHIIPHSKGGKTVYSNLVMCRAAYNIEMGVMDYNEYIKSRKKAA